MRSTSVGLIAATGWAAPALAPVVPAVAWALRIPRRLGGTADVLLTFDDGPHPRGTPAVLEVLRQRQARALFFVVGEQVERFPSALADILAEGHTVGMHAYRHRFGLRLPPGTATADARRALHTIGDATGNEPRLYRPPYGVFTAEIVLMTRRLDLRPLLWSHHGADWSAKATPGSIAWRVTRRMNGGDVLLLHDADHYSASGSWQRTALALPTILDRIEELGLQAALPNPW